MKYGMLSLASPIHEKNRVRETINRLMSDLRRKLEIEEISAEGLGRVEFPLICLLTGGTEHEFRELYPKLVADGRPITVLTLPHSNSLPAGLEILAWLNAQGAKSARLLHGDAAELARKIDFRGKSLSLVRSLRESVVGVVGAPSDWLIASSVNATLFRQRLGLSIRDIPIGEVYDSYQMITDQDLAGGFHDLPNPMNVVEPTDSDRDRALKLYVALRRLVAGHGLSALTLRCFDLVQKLGTTGCVALSKLNDEGITAGCEGDVPSLITMHIHRLLSGEASFMANPSMFVGDDIVFAHCAVASSIVKDITWRSHFESGIGIGIAGEFPPGRMTVMRLGGSDLGRLFIAEGDVVPHEYREDLCRTQVRIRIPGAAEVLGRVPLGNHHVLARGSWSSAWREALEPFGIAIDHIR